MTTEKGKEFLLKLKALMEKYRMSFGVEYGEGTDTHGITGETFVIAYQEPNSFRYKTVFETYGTGLTCDDLKKLDTVEETTP